MASNIHKSITLNSPNVVAPLASREDVAALSEIPDLSAHCDVLELRLDGLDSPGEALARTASLSPTLPIIATARHPDEGGFGGLDAAARHALLAQALPFAAALDIEIRSLPSLAGLATEARDSQCLVIGSFHDFAATPGTADLRDTVRRGLDLGAHAIKIATRLHGPGELYRLIDLLEFFADRPLAVMGMGTLGMASRLLSAQCGSFLNYGYLVRPNAPGQWPARQLREILAALPRDPAPGPSA